MNQKDIELLLKDLCARLPHRVICKHFENTYELVEIDIKRGLVYLLRGEQYVPYSIIYGDEIKPYLRPMSSMTEEEKRLYYEYTFCRENEGYITDKLAVEVPELNKLIDFLNAHHFDYRGLIEKGLALEAPADMYND